MRSLFSDNALVKEIQRIYAFFAGKKSDYITIASVAYVCSDVDFLCCFYFTAVIVFLVHAHWIVNLCLTN